LNGKPTKDKVVWRNLVDVNDIKAAVTKLQEINWLYKEVENSAVDSTINEAIEVVSKASSTMLEKATEDDLSEKGEIRWTS